MLTTRITPRAYAIKEASVPMSRKNYSKGEFIKRMMKEQKATFGALLETKKQKMQRLKRENSGSITKNENPPKQDDSEFSWMMNVSEYRLRRIRVNSDKKIEPQDPQDVRLSDFVPTFEKRISPAYTDSQLPRVQKTIIHRSAFNKNKFSFTIVDKDYVPVSKPRNHQIRPNGTHISLGRDRILSDYPRSVVVKNLRSNGDFKISRSDLENLNNNLESRLSLVSTPLSPATEKLESKTTEPEKTITKTTTLILQPRAKLSRPEIVTTKVKKVTAKSTIKQAKETKPKIKCAKPTEVSDNLDSLPEPNLNSQVQSILENIKTAKLYATTYDMEIRQETPLGTMKNLQFLRFPIVTQILEATMSTRQQSCRQWCIRKLVEGFGREVFDEYRQDVLQTNKLFHSSVSCELRNLPYQVPQDLELCLKSLRPILKEVEDVKVIDSQIVHKTLGYRGVMDCLATFRGNLCLIKWKANRRFSGKTSSSVCDASLQIAAYAGALNADQSNPFKVKSGILMTAYRNGNPPLIQQLDEEKLQSYWREWLARLKKYYKQRSS